jgi:hypothetical protein
MVVVAQLVEHRVVVPGVAGSSPVDHPNQFLPVKAPIGAFAISQVSDFGSNLGAEPVWPAKILSQM